MTMISFAQALRDAMREEMHRDENVYLVGEDIGLYGGCFGVSRGMLEEFGEARVVETPISETAFTGAAVGSALLGLRPIVEIMFGDFVSLTVRSDYQSCGKISFYDRKTSYRSFGSAYAFRVWDRCRCTTFAVPGKSLLEYTRFEGDHAFNSL